MELNQSDLDIHSEQSLLELATDSLGKMVEDPPPGGVTILEITKLKKGAILLLFNSKEAAEWIQQDNQELSFSVGFISGAKFKPRQ
jgi:hypothetical protein